MAPRYEDTWKGWWERFASQWLKGRGRGGQGSGNDVQEDEESGHRLGTVRGLLLVGLLGAGLMMVGQGSRDEVVTSESTALTNGVVTPASTDYDDFVDELEREVTVVVTQIAGVGHAEVLIVPKTSEIKVLAQEVTERTQVTQTTPQGQESVTTSRDESVTRRPVIVNNDSMKTQEPVIEYIRKPEVAGVLVVAEGAHDARIRLQLLEAVSAVLDVPPHRVEILARKK